MPPENDANNRHESLTAGAEDNETPANNPPANNPPGANPAAKLRRLKNKLRRPKNKLQRPKNIGASFRFMGESNAAGASSGNATQDTTVHV